MHLLADALKMMEKSFVLAQIQQAFAVHRSKHKIYFWACELLPCPSMSDKGIFHQLSRRAMLADWNCSADIGESSLVGKGEVNGFKTRNPAMQPCAGRGRQIALHRRD
jgi:hypothetical protein